MKTDLDYFSCKKKECTKYQNVKCAVTTCSDSMQFHVIKIRSGIDRVRVLLISWIRETLHYGHLSSIDSI